MSERTGIVTLLGNPVTLTGNPVEAGDQAPTFKGLTNDLTEFSSESLTGKTVILLTVPSVDTPVCDTEVRRFNEKASGLADNVVVVVASVDLPFAQSRWCGNAGVDRIHVISDHRDLDIGMKFGVVIKEARLLARSAFVISPSGSVVLSHIVPEVGDEPDYEAILKAASAA